MLERAELIRAIIEVSAEIGRPPGRVIFERLSGIRRHEWHGRHFARWSEALRAAGFTPNPRNSAIEENRLLGEFVALVATLGHIPSEGELGLETRRGQRFPASSTLRARFGSKHELLRRALVFATARQYRPDVVSLIAAAVSDAERGPRTQTGSDNRPIRIPGYVYMMRAGNCYKIGRTNKPDRRQFELDLQLPQKVQPIHAIETDDPSGIEAYWHRRFHAKRLNGEWFRLSRHDVTDFKRRKFM